VCDYLHTKSSFHNEDTSDTTETYDRSVSFRPASSTIWNKMLYLISVLFHVTFFMTHTCLSLTSFREIRLVAYAHRVLTCKLAVFRIAPEFSRSCASSSTKIADTYVQSHLLLAATECHDLECGFNTDLLLFASVCSTNSFPVTIAEQLSSGVSF